MKEVKSYFNEGNALNKGFAKSQPSDVRSKMRAKIDEELPPYEVIAEYEDLYPGISAKMVEMLEKEQQQRHKLEEVKLQMQQKAYNMGRLFAFLIICIFCYVIMQLAFNASIQMAVIFAAISFSTLFVIALINRPTKDRNHHSRENRPFHKKPHFRPKSNRNRKAR